MKHYQISLVIIAITMMAMGSSTAFAQKKKVPNRLQTRKTPQAKTDQVPQKRVYETLQYSEALENQANQGDAVAQVYIGRCYLEGKGIAKNGQRAELFFRQAAKLGNADGCYYLSKCLPYGDEQKTWYNKAVEMESPVALYDKGCSYEIDARPASQPPTDPDGTKATAMYKRSAELGYAEAQYKLAQRYLDGKGTLKDSIEGIKWLRKCGEQRILSGYVRSAQYQLALHYEFEMGNKPDVKESIYWYTLAADQGRKEAQWNLGRIYYFGKYGTAKNLPLAYHYWKMAAEQGESMAQCNIGIMLQNGEGITKDINAAFRWYQKAAAGGNVPAIYNLGECYYNGTGTVVNKMLARQYIQDAANKGNESAKKFLQDHNF